jgi:hypothetical protein
METSLTTVLAEPPLPPDPELPPADCEDDVSDVSDVADVDDVADVADVDDAAEDDVAAVDADAVTAALVEAIALIDMKTSLAGNLGRSADGAPCSLLFNAAGLRSRRRARKKSSLRRAFRSKHQQPITTPRVATSSHLSGDTAVGRDRRRPPSMDSHLVSRPCELERGR